MSAPDWTELEGYGHREDRGLRQGFALQSQGFATYATERAR